MITFGLTGGVASGKSTVSRTFIKAGIPMVDADIIAREVVQPGTDGLHSIVELFGSNMLLSDGFLNRSKLADLVFNNPDLKLREESMNALNSLMAPLIQEEGARQINKLHAAGHSIVGWDAALIVEAGNADKYRPLIVVVCSRKSQLERLCSRNNLTRQEAMNRINAQISVEQRVKFADHRIYTEGSVEDSILQTEKIIEILKQQEK